MFAYVGTYTDQPPGTRGHGEGIYLIRLDPAQARLETVKLAARTPSPSWIALSPDRRFLYAANELDEYAGAKSGSVSAFAIDRLSGALRPLNTVASGGGAPAHLSVHPSGRFILVANYGGGSVAVLPVEPGGSLGAAVDLQTDAGPRNPDRAADEPPGNFAESDHSAAHVHMVAADPTGRFVVASDAGLDRLYVWRFDLSTGKLAPADPPFVAVEPGSAPRHFVFHPNGRLLYSLTEHEGRVLVFGRDAQGGGLIPLQSVSVLPPGFGRQHRRGRAAYQPGWTVPLCRQPPARHDLDLGAGARWPRPVDRRGFDPG